MPESIFNDDVFDGRMFTDEAGLLGFVAELIEAETLEGAALDIAKYAVRHGVGKLSPRQFSVFKERVVEEYSHPDCDRCSTPIPWEEMFMATDTGMCAWCEHMSEKIMHE